MTTAWDKIDTATNRQPAPNFLYYLIAFHGGEYMKTLTYRPSQGFGYLLRNVTAFWYGNTPTIAGIVGLDAPTIEFYVRRQSRQANPVPLNVETSPASSSESSLANYPKIGERNIPPLGFKCAQPLKSDKKLNYFFQFGDTLEFHLYRQPNYIDTLNDPALIAQGVHFVLKGYDVPEPQARIW
jgi:hypothetical protein